MQARLATLRGQPDLFVATQWSVVFAAGESQMDANGSHAALAQLCQIYWPPLYTFARARGYSLHDAQDLTQGFFAYLLEHKIYKRADPEKGKFRSFLLGSFKHFLSDARDRAQTLKRGGGHEFLPLNEGIASAAESLFQTQHSLGDDALMEDRLFERSWAETLVATTLERVAADYEAEGKQKLFEELKSFLTVGAIPPPTYAALGARLRMPDSSLRSQVARLRARYREILRAEVRRTVSSAAEVDGELRELLRLLSNV